MIFSKFNTAMKSMYLIILIITSTFFSVLLFEGIVNEDGVEADSKWIQTSDLDFNEGTLDKVTVIPNGEVRLALETKYIKDDFVDML